MIHFLEKTLSEKRLETYRKLALVDSHSRSFEDLYSLNLRYSKELYVILSALEISIRNAFNNAIADHYKRQDWFSLNLLKPKHQEQINKAVKHVTETKHSSYVFDDVIAHLNFGFWSHLCDRPYEKTLWNNCLYKCFPRLGQKPNRADIQRRLSAALILRNKIAHMEPIIKNEENLIQDFRNIIQLLYAICPDTQSWFEKNCDFEVIWKNRFGDKNENQ